MVTAEQQCTARRSPMSAVILVLGLGLFALGLVAAWAWYGVFEKVMSWGAVDERFIVVAGPGLWVWVVAVAAAVGLGWLFHRGPERRVVRFVLLQLPWLLMLVPFLLLSPGGVTTEFARVFAWKALPGVFLVIALASSAWSVWPGLAQVGAAPRPGWRLWLVLFLLVHLPALWFVKPWMPRFYQHRGIGGDEPEILLVTHSLATDLDFNLYNNRALGHRNLYIVPSNVSMGQTDEDYAARAAKWGAGEPHTTPEYWHTRRFNMYRPGLGLTFVPGYRIGLKWGKHQRYGVVCVLSVLLTFAMANIFLLARRVSGSGGAALLAALTTGLSGPMMFYGIAAYPDPIDAALLIFAVRKLYDFYRNRREGIASTAAAHLWTAAAILYMPWVHEKMLGFAGLLLLAYFVIARPGWKIATAVLSLVLVSVGLQMRYYWILYGHVYPVYVHPEPFALGYLKQGGLGLLLDRDRGIMDVAPWFIAGVLGLLLWLRKEPAFSAMVVFLVASFWMTTASFGGWYAGACPQPRYLVNIMPFFGVGLALAWQRAVRPGARALLLALCGVGVLQGVSGVLITDKLDAGPSMFNAIFPVIFDLGPALWPLLLAWLGLLLWICGFLLLERMRTSYAALIVPLAVVILAESWILQDVYARTSVNVGATERVLDILRGPLSLDARFNRRIALHRWLTLHYPGTPKLVPEIPGIVEAEDLAKEELTPVPDAAASRGAFIAACGDRNDIDRPIGKPVQTMHEGSYRAEFRVRGRKSDANSSVALVVARRLNLRTTIQERRMPAGELSREWQNVAVPFELPAPTRFVGFAVELENRACVDADFVKLSWIAPPGLSWWRY